ncbi:MAG: esterase [Rubrivivax sp.]|nr:esterase [Rubrivivax sp.]
MQLVIEHLPAQGRPEQLLVLLHGWAQPGRAMAGLASALQAAFAQAAVLVPEAPTPADGGRRGRMWYSIEGLRDSPDTWPARVADQLGPMQAWLQAQQQRLGVAPAATCLAGFSQGAVLSLELVTRHDGIAGRVLAFGGRFVQPPALPPRQTTLHFLHGDADDIFPAAELQQAFDHLARQQGDATLDIAHGVGHELHPALVDRALFRLRNHIPLRTWQAALGASPAVAADTD